MGKELSIAETFVILAQHPDKGRYRISDIQLNYGLLGAIIFDLAADKTIEVSNDRFLKILSENQLNNYYISAFSDIVNKNIKKQKRIKWWIKKIAQKATKIRRAVLEGLEDKQVITLQRKRFLGLIPYRVAKLKDKSLQQDIIIDLRRIFKRERKLTDKDVAVLCMIDACKMYRVIARDRKEAKSLQRVTHELVKDNVISVGIAKAIQEIQAAIATSVVVAAT